MQKSVREQLIEYFTMTKEADRLYGLLAEKRGMSDAMFWVLYAIHFHGNTCTQKDICGLWFMSKQTVHSALKSLHREGYIELEPSPEDRRKKFIALTESGSVFVNEHIRPIMDAEEKAMGALAAEERTVLLSSARRFEEELKAQLSKLQEEREKD